MTTNKTSTTYSHVDSHADDSTTAQPADSPHEQPPDPPEEIGGRAGPDPTRYGDWEKNGRCIDF